MIDMTDTTTPVTGDITIKAHGSNWSTGNRMRRRDERSERRYKFEEYFVVRVKHYIGAGEPMAMLTFVGLNHSIEVELAGDVLTQLSAALSPG